MASIVPGSLAAEWVTTGYAPFLFAGLVLAGIGTLLVFGLGLVAYRRRGSTQYLLVTLALGLLVVRTVVGWGTVFGMVPMVVHHLLEHGFDFLVAVIILYTVYRSRSSDPPSAGGGRRDARQQAAPRDVR